MVATTSIMQRRRSEMLRSLGRLWFLCLGLSVVFATSSHAITVGPKFKPKVEVPTQDQDRELPGKLDLVPLQAVVSILDPGFIATDPDLDKKGIWPELRHTESIRCAIKLKESLIAINQFDSVYVVPDTSASADFYLVGMIKESTGEILRIQYMLVDATGKTWLNETNVHRVEPGWHQRFAKPGVDPFQPLYDEIAGEVWKVLKRLAADHTKVAKDNRSRGRKGKSTQLSQVELISAVRELVHAQYFNPDLYSDALTLGSGNNRAGSYRIKYLPDKSSTDWQTIEKIAARDREFLRTVNKHYDQFMTEVNPSYEEWQEDSFPYAREIRLAKRAETLANVTTGVLAVATIASAVEANDSDSRDKALAIGGVLTSAALLKGMMDRNRKNRELARFNELTQSYHDSFKPIRVRVGGEIVTLEGTVINQYNQWRELLTDIYAQENSDFESVIIEE